MPEPSGLTLGLAAKSFAPESVDSSPGGCELVFTAKSDNEVDEVFADWNRRGITILSRPESVYFGRYFMARDLDGHLLRVLAQAS